MTDLHSEAPVVTEKQMLVMACEIDPENVLEMINQGVFTRYTASSLTVFHLAAYFGNGTWFDTAASCCENYMRDPGSSKIDFAMLSQYMTTCAIFTMKNGVKKMFTPVHLAVLGNRVDILRTMAFWDRQHEAFGYSTALETPANETDRPKGLAKSLYGTHHEISELVGVIKDPAGSPEPDMTAGQKTEFVGEFAEFFANLDTSDAVCRIK